MSTEAAIPVDPTRHFAFWPKRLPRAIATPDTSLWANLDITYRRYPERPAIIFFDHVMTYRALYTAVESRVGWARRAHHNVKHEGSH